MSATLERIAGEMLQVEQGGSSRLELIARALDELDRIQKAPESHGEMQADLRRWARELGEAI